MGDPHLPEGWTKFVSKKFKREYYFHEATNRSVWVHPSQLKDKKQVYTIPSKSNSKLKTKIRKFDGDFPEKHPAKKASGSLESFTSGSLSEKDLQKLESDVYDDKRHCKVKTARIANWAEEVTKNHAKNTKGPKDEKKLKQKVYSKSDAKKEKIKGTQFKTIFKSKNENNSNTVLTPAMQGIINRRCKKQKVQSIKDDESVFSLSKARYVPYKRPSNNKKETDSKVIEKVNSLPVLKPLEIKGKIPRKRKDSAQSNYSSISHVSSRLPDPLPQNRKLKDAGDLRTEIISNRTKKSQSIFSPNSSSAGKFPFKSSHKTQKCDSSKNQNPFLSKTKVNPFHSSSKPDMHQKHFLSNQKTENQQAELQSLDDQQRQHNLFISDVNTGNSTTAYQPNNDQDLEQLIIHTDHAHAINRDNQLDVEENMEVDDAVDFSREIMREIRDIRADNALVKPQISDQDENMQLPIYTDPLYIVLDTNVLLGHLKFISELKDHPIPGVGPPILVIPWIVLQELDSLKDAVNRHHSQVNSDGVEEKTYKLNILARKAIKFISTCLEGEHPRVKGESAIEAGTPIDGFNEESNDDSIIHCALSLKSKAAHSHIAILSNDKNLCNKALVMGIKSFSQQSILLGLRSLFQSGTVAVRNENYTEYYDEYKVQEIIAERKKQADDLSCELQCILREGYSKVIEAEMKNAYGDDMWLQIIKIQPPWTLHDVFTLLDKHWIAVFGMIVQRSLNVKIKELKNMFIGNEGRPGKLENVKEMLDLSLVLFEGFAIHSSYDSMLTKCVTGTRVLLGKCTECIKQMSNHHELPPAAVRPYLPSTNDQSHDTGEATHLQPNASDGLNPYQKVLETFDGIWRTVTHYSALIFYSLNFPSPLTKELDAECVKPSRDEALACLKTMTPCLLSLIKSLQEVTAIAVENLQNSNQIIIVLRTVYTFMKEVMKEDCQIAPDELFQFCSDDQTRSALVKGLSQLDRSYATLQQCVIYHS